MPDTTTDFSPDHPIKVFLLDDHEVVRRGLVDLLTSEPDIQVVGESAAGEQALVRAPALRPDVAVLDIRLADMDGISVCRELRSRLPETARLMLHRAWRRRASWILEFDLEQSEGSREVDGSRVLLDSA
ncbi:response regulator [Streptomyces sp. SID8379]|nr:response regulator [Streptomyces sp. SID8379]